MRISRFSFAVAATLLLSACGSVHDDPAKHNDLSNWMNSRPSKIEESAVWKLPHGYAGHNQNLREIRSADGTVSVFPVDDAPQTAVMVDDATMLAPVTDMSHFGNLAQTVYFEHGMALISTSDRGALKAMANNLADGVSVSIVGHASTRVNTTDDPIRKKTINFEIAQKRANAVTKVLQSAGVNPSMVTAMSKGDEEPNQMPGTRDQEAADRRVEVYTK
jgi:outer membrane protein OmpA-like peptidoglycan-associated protein